MAITLRDIAIRALQKRQVIGADETPSAEDLDKALEKVRSAHEYMKVEELVRWTLNYIPGYAEEPYIYITAYFLSNDFGLPADPELITIGTIQLRRAANLGASGRTQAEYF